MSSKPSGMSMNWAKVVAKKLDASSNTIKSSDDIPKINTEPVPTVEKPGCEFRWHCPIDEFSNKVINDSEILMMNVMRSKAAGFPARCNIRRGPHDETRATNGAIVPDNLGWHITAEYLDPKDKMWYHLHLYLTKIDDNTYVVNKTLKPNLTWTDPTTTASAKGTVKRTFFRLY